MKKLKFKTDFKFKFTIVVISLLMFIGVLSYQFTGKNFYIISTVIGVLSLIAIIISVVGLLKSIKKLKKPKSKKRIFTLIVISITVCLFLYIIIANLIDAFKYIA